MKAEEEDDKKRKSLLTKIISYFKYDSKLDKKINHSLLFNSYVSIFETIGMIFLNVYFTTIKLDTYVLMATVSSGAQVCLNFTPRISIKMLFFQIMLGGHVTLIGIMCLCT
jgi:hypothetical protein